MIELSVVISNYNSNEDLPNTFYSLSRQKTDFDWEVCFLDDCSWDDPLRFYNEFLTVKNKKGMRLKQHIGNLGQNVNFPNHPWFRPSTAIAFDMVAETSKIVVLLLSDIVLPQDDILQKFHDRMEPKVVQTPWVWTWPVPHDLYKNFEEGIKPILADCDKGALYQSTIPPREYQYPCLMPFYKETLKEVEMDKCMHEVELSIRMRQRGYTLVKSEDIVAVHQMHGGRPNVVACASMNFMNWSPDCPERYMYA